MAQVGKYLFLIGLVLVVVFFASAPKSPVYSWIPSEYSNLLGSIGLASGLLALALIVTGYVLYQFETKPRPVAYYNIGFFATLLSWMAISNLIKEFFFSSYGLLGMLISLIVASPVIVISYFLMLKPLQKKAKRTYAFVIIKSGSSEEKR
ncbi:MAG: hypothetical protein GSR81_00320 [Desulfurococcales archaeon]|nr:hypothetical protein [Desulfurococcales archaeon]